MARYFKFHTLDDLRAECVRLGLSLRFQDDLAPLFRSIRIGELREMPCACSRWKVATAPSMVDPTS